MIQSILRRSVDEVSVRLEVASVLRTVVESVDVHAREAQLQEALAGAAALKADVEFLVCALGRLTEQKCLKL